MYLGYILPPCGKNWQLIYPNFKFEKRQNFKNEASDMSCLMLVCKYVNRSLRCKIILNVFIGIGQIKVL
jgi:hypothetical protein